MAKVNEAFSIEQQIKTTDSYKILSSCNLVRGNKERAEPAQCSRNRNRNRNMVNSRSNFLLYQKIAAALKTQIHHIKPISPASECWWVGWVCHRPRRRHSGRRTTHHRSEAGHRDRSAAVWVHPASECLCNGRRTCRSRCNTGSS
jgi:hypothetical protein